MLKDNWSQFHPYLLQLEQEGLVTRTFRRLDPHRQQEILAAILAEATEKGPTAANIKQVAERANASIGSMYTYFPNREGMLDFAIELCVRFMTDSFDAFLPYLVDLPLRDALAAYLTVGVEWSQTQIGMVSFFARAAYHGDPELIGRLVQPIAAAMREMVLGILSQAAARGELRADIDLEALLDMILKGIGSS
jgi:AcrR family transcriptional regulator